MPLLIKSLPTLHFLMGFLIGCLTLAFLLRIILTWYPKIDLKTGLWPIVFLPMAVDFLHHGHIRIIKKARKYGSVIVGLMTDSGLKSYKGLPVLNFRQ